MYRELSVLLSYIKRRSRTLEFEKSLIANRPSASSGSGSEGSVCEAGAYLASSDCWSLANGPVFGAASASMVWFWMFSARLSLHEVETILSANMDSIEVWGANSSSNWVR